MVNPCCTEDTRLFSSKIKDVTFTGLPYQKHFDGIVPPNTKKEIKIYDRRQEIYDYSKLLFITFIVSDSEIPIKLISTISGADITLLNVSINVLKNMGYMNTQSYPIYVHVYGADNDGDGVPEYGAILSLNTLLRGTAIEKIKLVVDNITSVNVKYAIDIVFEVV